MKKINSHKIIALLGVVAMSFWATSCLKDNYTDFSKVGNVVEMLDAIPGASTALTLGSGDSTFMIRVNQAGPEATTEDIVVTLGVSQIGLDLYNTDTTHVVGELLADSAFSFPTTVTIKAGLDSLGNKNRTATFPLVIHGGKLPKTVGKNYVISMGITSTSPTMTVSANFGAILFNFYHNTWDGYYTVTGTMTDVTSATLTGDYPMPEQIVTINANNSSTYSSLIGGNFHPILSSGSLSYYGAVGMDFQFDNNNNVIAVTNPYSDPLPRGRKVRLDGTGVNKYDPATKTLKVKYIMYQADIGDRSFFDETWVWQHN